MKKTILLMLALALLCTVLCACSEGGNVNDNEGGFVTDRGNEREGLVFKEVGTTRPRSFKAVSNRYLLKIR